MPNSTEDVFRQLQQQSSESRTVIIGGGIVGSALAYHLSSNSGSSQVVLLDPSLSSPQGSTAFAPGFVGQLNSVKHLTKTAKETVAAYSKIPGAFNLVGGLEIASTEAGIAELHHRQNLARSAGLSADILSSAEASNLAPDFHSQDGHSKALFFGTDGTVDPPKIVQYYQAEAKSNGVVTLALAVSAISKIVDGDEDVGLNVTTDVGTLRTKTVIVATGIWTAELMKNLGVATPIIPVLHPYAYGPSRPRRKFAQPFVRWPEKHIYARDHGEVDGFGTYDHKPIPCHPKTSALFDRTTKSGVLDSALSVFPNSAQRHSKTPYQGFQAMFSVTPDSLPLAGAVPQIPGLYLAAAIWITHAAGVARLIADVVLGRDLPDEDLEVLKAFDAMRFQGEDVEVLKTRALATYNDIYNKNDHL